MKSPLHDLEGTQGVMQPSRAEMAAQYSSSSRQPAQAVERSMMSNYVLCYNTATRGGLNGSFQLSPGCCCVNRSKDPLSWHSNSLPPHARYSICSRDLSFELILLLFLQSSTFAVISVLPFQNHQCLLSIRLSQPLASCSGCQHWGIKRQVHRLARTVFVTTDRTRESHRKGTLAQFH